MPYLLDTNVFIEAKNRYYGFDFCPAFWDWLVKNNSAGVVFSIEKVEDELKAGADELADWASHRGDSFFLKPDAATLPAFSALATWATSQSYEPAAITTFTGDTDFYLVAHALAHQLVVVTHETPSGSTRKIKIPDACIGVSIKCMTPYDMLRVERARFILA